MKKNIPDKEIKKIVKGWLLKLKEAHERGYSITSGYQMECPSCKSDTIYFDGTKKIWCCSNPSCKFIFPKHLMPPKLKEIEEHFQRERIKEVGEYIKMFLNS